jgi:hypothetical protein
MDVLVASVIPVHLEVQVLVQILVDVLEQGLAPQVEVGVHVTRAMLAVV